MNLMFPMAHPVRPSLKITASVPTAARPPKRAPLASGGHDLPVLAAAEDPRGSPEWEALLEDGVQPALVLGAERRLGGRR